MMHAMRGIDGHERHECRKNDHQRAQAVDSQVVLNAERRNPVMQLLQTDRAVRRQMQPDDQRKHETKNAGDLRNSARMAL